MSCERGMDRMCRRSAAAAAGQDDEMKQKSGRQVTARPNSTVALARTLFII